MDAATEHFGIRLDGAPNSRIIGNVVAGHAYDLLVAGGEQFYVFGESLVLLKPESSQENPAEGKGAAGIMVEGNTVGLSEANPVPAGATQKHGVTIFGGAQAVTLRSNVIAGHTENEVWLVDGVGHVVAGNRLGTPMAPIMAVRRVCASTT